jgi:glycosyltransferase involved in cell wall biosynthesis
MNPISAACAPIVSVVVPTFNRVELLLDLLRSLRNQTLAPDKFEVIVIDNGSTDDTSQQVAALAAEPGCRITCHRIEPNVGPVRARNIGASLVSAPIIAFTDSDCRAHPEWLERALEMFQQDPDLGMLSGAMLDKPEQLIRFFTIRNAAGPGENFAYPACNIFYRRSVFEALGGFDQSAWLFEIAKSPIEFADTDLAWRLRESGHKNAYSDDLIVYHEVFRATLVAWLMYPARILVTPELIRRHPEIRRKMLYLRLFFARENIIFYLFWIGIIAAVFWWPLVLLCLPYLYWAATIGTTGISFHRIPRIIARVPLLFARHCVICGSLIFGSLRFGRLVL